jgi:hypothetical protein
MGSSSGGDPMGEVTWLMPKHTTWIITTEPDRPIREIADDLAKAGLQDGVVLDEIGSITGTADEKVVSKLRKVRGVKDVSADSQIDIGPPDSSETW